MSTDDHIFTFWLQSTSEEKLHKWKEEMFWPSKLCWREGRLDKKEKQICKYMGRISRILCNLIQDISLWTVLMDNFAELPLREDNGIGMGKENNS